jgi:lactoylglutathione lyase
MKLNHLNLTVTDAMEAREFLERYFGLRGMKGRSRGFQMLFDDSDLVLTLIKVTAEEVKYPRPSTWASSSRARSMSTRSISG